MPAPGDEGFALSPELRELVQSTFVSTLQASLDNEPNL